MNPDSIMEDLYVLKGFQAEYDSLQSKLSDIAEQVKADNDKNPYPIITFLGTGSSIPNKSRNTSGILLTFELVFYFPLMRTFCSVNSNIFFNPQR